MGNFEAFRWNFLSSTNSEIGRSLDRMLHHISQLEREDERNVVPRLRRNRTREKIHPKYNNAAKNTALYYYQDYYTVVFQRAGKDQDHLRVEMKLGHHHFEMHFHPVDAQCSSLIILPSLEENATKNL